MYRNGTVLSKTIHVLWSSEISVRRDKAGWQSPFWTGAHSSSLVRILIRLHKFVGILSWFSRCDFPIPPALLFLLSLFQQPPLPTLPSPHSIPPPPSSLPPSHLWIAIFPLYFHFSFYILFSLSPSLYFYTFRRLICRNFVTVPLIHSVLLCGFKPLYFLNNFYSVPHEC